MSRNTFKIGVSILTFVIGITMTAIWLIYPLSQNSITEVSPPEVLTTEEAEEYAVYSAVIKNYLKERKLREPLLISNRTTFYGNQMESVVFGDNFLHEMTAEQRVSQIKMIAPSVSEEILFDLDRKQIKSKELRPKLNLPVEYLLVNENSKEDYLTEGSIRFSSVGFNKQRNQAYVFMQFVCRVLCSSSDSLFLEKVEGNWRIKEIFVGFRS